VLNIAVIGYNMEHTISGAKAIAENDEWEKIRSICGTIEMDGGTRYVPVYKGSTLSKGKRFDQLIILCDEDELAWILSKNIEAINETIAILSPLFSEFPCQIQCYDF
jgi:hypothetical protein